MKKIRSLKPPFNIRNKLCFLGSLCLLFILAIAVWSSSAFTHKVQAAEGGNPMFKVSLEQYLKDPSNNIWSSYSNTTPVSRQNDWKC